VLDVPPELLDGLLTAPRPYDEPPAARRGRAARRPGPRRSRKPLVWAAVLAAVLLLVGGATYTLSSALYTTVPGVLGQSQAQAVSVLDAAGLQGRFTEVFSESVPAGQVIAADPGVGQRVRKSDAVAVTVSRGPKRIPVPDVTGKSADQARQALAGRQLAVGTGSEEYSDTVAQGSVISSSPAAGEQVPENTPVSLVVSKGMVPVPDVRGMSKDDATKALQEAGFKVQSNGLNLFGTGKVSDQSPAAGQRRPQGATVVLTFPLI
jgi:serine/threonine-protein kinase